MNNFHISVPVKPTIELIEAMIEASISHSGNVEKIYAAVIQHLTEDNRRLVEELPKNYISRMEIAGARHATTEEPGVLLRTYVGPQDLEAEVFMLAPAAFSLATDIIYRAVSAREAT